MKFFKNNPKILALSALFLSDLFCLFIMQFELISYTTDTLLYVSGIKIVQFLYFLPTFFGSFYIFFTKHSEKKVFLSSTIAFILYAILLHFFIRQIASIFTNISGEIHFIQYASKIYLIGLPFLSLKILLFQKENFRNSFFFVRIISFLFTSFLFKTFFGLNGIFYNWPFHEFLCVLFFFFQQKNSTS